MALHWPFFRLLFFHCGSGGSQKDEMGDNGVATPHPQPALDEARGKGTLTHGAGLQVEAHKQAHGSNSECASELRLLAA